MLWIACNSWESLYAPGLHARTSGEQSALYLPKASLNMPASLVRSCLKDSWSGHAFAGFSSSGVTPGTSVGMLRSNTSNCFQRRRFFMSIDSQRGAKVEQQLTFSNDD